MAGDAALDLLIDERLTPFSRRILPSVSLSHLTCGCDCDTSTSQPATAPSSARNLHVYSLDIMVWAKQGGTKAPLAPLPAGLKTKEGIALLLREEPALRKDIFNAYVTTSFNQSTSDPVPDDAHRLTPLLCPFILVQLLDGVPAGAAPGVRPACGRPCCVQDRGRGHHHPPLHGLRAAAHRPAHL